MKDKLLSFSQATLFNSHHIPDILTMSINIRSEKKETDKIFELQFSRNFNLYCRTFLKNHYADS